MILARRLALSAAAASMLSTAACTTDPVTGERTVNRAGIGAALGAAGGALGGALIGGRRSRTETLLGAGIGALGGAAVGNYMDRQERDLRERTAGTGIDVRREGDDLLLNIPSGITFATNSYAIEPQFRTTLDKVADTLDQYGQTLVDVYGHTDSTGGPDINEPLSDDRARSVADYLTTRGVRAERIRAEGFAATQPVASNDTSQGRAQNRRVEIRIVPLREDVG